MVAVDSTATVTESYCAPETLLEVLEEWGCKWIWDSLSLTADGEWLIEAIEEGICVAVTDGLYIREFFRACAWRHLSLNAQEAAAPSWAPLMNSAYRAELLGLMAIHLILLAANKLRPELKGMAAIFSNCLGVIRRMPTGDKSPCWVEARWHTQEYHGQLPGSIV